MAALGAIVRPTHLALTVLSLIGTTFLAAPIARAGTVTIDVRNGTLDDLNAAWQAACLSGSFIANPVFAEASGQGLVLRPEFADGHFIHNLVLGSGCFSGAGDSFSFRTRIQAFENADGSLNVLQVLHTGAWPPSPANPIVRTATWTGQAGAQTTGAWFEEAVLPPLARTWDEVFAAAPSTPYEVEISYDSATGDQVVRWFNSGGIPIGSRTTATNPAGRVVQAVILASLFSHQPPSQAEASPNTTQPGDGVTIRRLDVTAPCLPDLMLSLKDTDGDGLLDGFESAFGGSPAHRSIDLVNADPAAVNRSEGCAATGSRIHSGDFILELPPNTSVEAPASEMHVTFAVGPPSIAVVADADLAGGRKTVTMPFFDSPFSTEVVCLDDSPTATISLLDGFSCTDTIIPIPNVGDPPESVGPYTVTRLSSSSIEVDGLANTALASLIDGCPPCDLPQLVAMLPDAPRSVTTHPCFRLRVPPPTDACCTAFDALLPTLPGTPEVPTSHPCFTD